MAMVRVLNSFFPKRTLLLAAAEALLAILVLVGIAYFWMGADAELYLAFELGYTKITVFCAVFMLMMYYFDLYDSAVMSSARELYIRFTQVVGTSALLLALVYYMLPELQLGRQILWPGIIGVAIAIIGGRQLFFALNRTDRFADRVVLLGTGNLARHLAQEVTCRPELGVRVLGYVGEASTPLGGLRRLGEADDLPELVTQHKIDRVIITVPDRRGHLPTEKLLQLKTQGILIQDGADFYEMVTGRLALDSLRLSWLLFAPASGISRSTLFSQRLASLVLSLFGLLISLPLMAVIAVAIWLDSKGPILFHQERVGEGGRVFTLHKFRSMRINGNGDGEFKPTSENDDRCTRVGRWLRRTRLDELPQLYNILRGDMSIVGPRPFARDEEEHWARQIPYYRLRWLVKPGVTGWAQIHRGYNATLEDNVDKLSYDLFYVKNMSLGLDLVILLQTIKIVLLGRGAR